VVDDPTQEKDTAPKPAIAPPGGRTADTGQESGVPPSAGEIAILLREIRDRLLPPADALGVIPRRFAAPPEARPHRLWRVHRVVKEIEPWGILLAIVGLFLALITFWIDYRGRVEERTVRAWQLLTTRASGNSGKGEALAYLNREDGLLCFEVLRGRLAWLHGDDEVSCLIFLKGRTPLTGIDLSPPDKGTPDDPLDDPPGAYLQGADLTGAYLENANLTGAYLENANITDASLRGANPVDLSGADMSRANLTRANLIRADLSFAVLFWADLSGANLHRAKLFAAGLSEANLTRANLFGADLFGANLIRADLSGAGLPMALLGEADFSRADLTAANLTSAHLVGTNFTGANLTGCHVYGISAWNLKLDGAEQKNLIITPRGEPEITVDNLEVAQFIYLLLTSEKIRDVIDTIGKKGVLLLGRFTGGRLAILERLREELRSGATCR
jgi:uncharacterized protein YjbI with pentapeptide repeats